MSLEATFSTETKGLPELLPVCFYYFFFGIWKGKISFVKAVSKTGDHKKHRKARIILQQAGSPVFDTCTMLHVFSRVRTAKSVPTEKSLLIKAADTNFIVCTRINLYLRGAQRIKSRNPALDSRIDKLNGKGRGKRTKFAKIFCSKLLSFPLWYLSISHFFNLLF